MGILPFFGVELSGVSVFVLPLVFGVFRARLTTELFPS